MAFLPSLAGGSPRRYTGRMLTVLLELLFSFLWSVFVILLGAGILHLIPLAGPVGKTAAEKFARAPLLDGVVAYFTLLPPIVAGIIAGWTGLIGAILGQVAGVYVWCFLHEIAHWSDSHGPRIVNEINDIVGRWQNHAALWVTAVALPAFWLVRLLEILIYPLLPRLINLPSYDHAEWINVSRQKFQGLVGHDLIWCLYCDWMTGVWSLGSEMLRNVESFWCPIKYGDVTKCERCRQDFPDIDNGWVSPDGCMAEVAALIREKYRDAPEHWWFGHPARLTIEGREPAEPAAPGTGAATESAEVQDPTEPRADHEA